jgi:nicotinic acid mononucleotide adenylyltransferase
MSSTQVRDARAQGRSIGHLVPDRVADVVERLGLYLEA